MIDLLGKNISAVRGAICVAKDEGDLIGAAAQKLWATLLQTNGLSEDDVACLLITQTSDLKSLNPATGLRRGGYCATTPLFCMPELEIAGMMERVIRMLIITNRPMEAMQPVFLDGAERLRPDLFPKSE
ncbi:MAG: chorismate mutase [Sphaerochaeta sp.]|jgi:chorismate mutase|nr:chorismate mutase [Spirochaetales bacterium]